MPLHSRRASSFPPREFSLERTQTFPRTPDEVFSFFASPANLEAITPPWLAFRIVEAPAELERGSLLRYRLKLFGVPVLWRTEIAEWLPPRSFVDRQLSGPYRLWEHAHRFTRVPGGTEVYDHVRYRIPFGPIGIAARRLFVAGWLVEIFDYRARRLRVLL
jgi:ligand-binding SRPBCC domain-containing protein